MQILTNLKKQIAAKLRPLKSLYIFLPSMQTAKNSDQFENLVFVIMGN